MRTLKARKAVSRTEQHTRGGIAGRKSGDGVAKITNKYRQGITWPWRICGFEDRLKVEYQVDDDTLDQPVPPMMLQTLVENAIKLMASVNR